MIDQLPSPVAAYFAASTPEQVANCFTVNGFAHDERQTYAGREAILRWREAVGKISFTQEMLSTDGDGETCKVTCRVSGNFKGSPVELDYAFQLEGDKIARLEIS